MSKEQVSIGELLLSLDSSDLQEAKQGRAAISQQLSSDRGGAVLCSLVDFYLNSSCALALTLLSSIREPLHKALLDKLNEAVSRPANRLAAVTLLGHMISRQPPWIHHVSRSPLLTSLLRCLKVNLAPHPVLPPCLPSSSPPRPPATKSRPCLTQPHLLPALVRRAMPPAPPPPTTSCLSLRFPTPPCCL
uniref:Hamartin-like n=1 Tax=Hippocampus comes TaxID=109280 RepID=A0A3Q3DPF1_HIPCM